jgi:hypothetical protein
MSTNSSPRLAVAQEEKDYSDGNEKAAAVGDSYLPPDGISIREGSDILSLQAVDPALNAKMHIVNNVGFPQAPFPPSRSSSRS